jgi:hypothetical protein
MVSHGLQNGPQDKFTVCEKQRNLFAVFNNNKSNSNADSHRVNQHSHLK